MPDLPVSALSHSGLRTLYQCSMRWKFRYIERAYEPPTGKMIRGTVFGAAETQSDFDWMESGSPLSTDDVLDKYADEWNALDQGEVNWEGEKPISIRESGEACLRTYHDELIPSMSRPVAVEREARVAVAHPDGTDVEFVAYMDVETEDGRVRDRKVSAAKEWANPEAGQAKADGDGQPTGYLAVRRAEGDPAAGFDFEVARPLKTPKALRVSTTRSDEVLDDFLARILNAADEIAWRAETETWSYAPEGAWWCSEKSCGYWSQCPGGGLFRRKRAEVVAEEMDRQIAEAVEAVKA